MANHRITESQNKKTILVGMLIMLLFICSCGSDGGSGSESLGLKLGSSAADFGCDGDCPHQNLSVEDVNRILKQGVSAATVLGVSATFAVTDRVGNVLAVYQMTGASPRTRVDGKIRAVGGLEGIKVLSTLAAISKAGTGAYLSSQGNAFSTRTASQIIQEHFNPGQKNQPGGPLFGVQFSQLLCSDVTTLNPELTSGLPSGNKAQIAGLVGPRPLPLGLSADPGGLPLYEQGDLVGGIGVELDGEYTLDRNIQDFDDNIEERIAMMASLGGFEIPSERIGDQIIVGGRSLRTVDLAYEDLDPLPDPLVELDQASIVAVPFYTNGAVKSGAVFGEAGSGILNINRAQLPAMILVNGSGSPRFPTRSGSSLPSGAQLRSNEVDAILDSALLTAHRARAAIRRPLDTAARVSIWVVDHLGIPLGMIRSQDAPVFGLDVALQKGRTAAFFSSADAGDLLNAIKDTNPLGGFEDYVAKARSFIGPLALTGAYAFTDRANGNLSRPFFVDGIDGTPNGPFSLPYPGSAVLTRSWSPFNTGLQLDLVLQGLAQPIGIPIDPPTSLPDSCTNSSILGSRLRNGIQIFPGSVPLYRGTTLIGAIGISGDGIDQDDLVAFYGASRQGLNVAGHSNVGDAILGFNAPKEIRSDNITTLPQPNVRLRYVNCPEAPFRDVNDQKVCNGM